MTLHVVVVAGQTVGARHPIKKDLVRLGSAAGCEISLAGEKLPAHALSLEISDDQCRIYNRMDRAIVCSGKSIGPNSSGAWPLHAELEIAPELVLRIEQGDAAAAPARAAWDEYPSGEFVLSPVMESGPGSPTSLPPAKSSQSVAQLVITVCCVAASAMMLWHKFGPQGAATAAPRATVTLNAVLDQLHSKTEAPWPQVQQAIQEAYRLDHSGDALGARKRYAKVVQLVLSRHGNKFSPDLPASGELTAADRRHLQDLASQLPDGIDRQVFAYAMSRL